MNTATVRCILFLDSFQRFRGINLTPYRHKVGAEDEPPSGFLLKLRIDGQSAGCNRLAQLVINFSEPTRRHSRATGAHDTQAILYLVYST